MAQRAIDTKLREWRVRRRLTLREISDLTGISPPMLSLAERGERRLAPLTKVAIARRLGAPLRELFEVEAISDEGVTV